MPSPPSRSEPATPVGAQVAGAKGERYTCYDGFCSCKVRLSALLRFRSPRIASSLSPC